MEMWKCALMQGTVKSFLPEIQACECSGPKGSSSAFQEVSKATELKLDVWACLQKIYLQAFCVFTAVNQGLCTESYPASLLLVGDGTDGCCLRFLQGAAVTGCFGIVTVGGRSR